MQWQLKLILIIGPSGIEIRYSLNIDKDIERLIIGPSGIEISFFLLLFPPLLLLIIGPSGIEMNETDVAFCHLALL